jgi:hypothetical protein
MGCDSIVRRTADGVFLMTHKRFPRQERSTKAIIISDGCPQCTSRPLGEKMVAHFIRACRWSKFVFHERRTLPEDALLFMRLARKREERYNASSSVDALQTALN